MDVKALLEAVRDGAVSVAEAQERLQDLPFEDMGFARLDHHRQLRKGFAEVVFGPGKTCEQLSAIFARLAEKSRAVLATRCTKEQYEAVQKKTPGARYHEDARAITLLNEPAVPMGLVAVCTGGTADIPVAEEAALTAELFGAKVERYYDVGIAGLHRLLTVLPEVRRANAVVAVAGMEGALPSVLAGLLEAPVVAVPTSVGYGAGLHGIAPLLTMLNSCAEGVGVVNIDNGFGGGYLAAQINRLAGRKPEERT